MTFLHHSNQAAHRLRDDQLALDRPQLEAMPGEWQARLAALLDEPDTIPELNGLLESPGLGALPAQV